MKTTKKLSLKKQTISHLEDSEMNAARGGTDASNQTICPEAQCQSGTCVSCIPYTRKNKWCYNIAMTIPTTATV